MHTTSMTGDATARLLGQGVTAAYSRNGNAAGAGDGGGRASSSSNNGATSSASHSPAISPAASSAAAAAAEAEAAAGAAAAAAAAAAADLESLNANSDLPLSPSQNAQLEADKRTIYKHPLFPLLALLFEKCEVATQSIDCSSSEDFNADIQVFIEQQQREKKPLLSDNAEANELMIKSLQVLRIHLLELEKVQELCKDFCNRYITCLKTKMQSENLLRSDYSGYDSDDSSGGAVVNNSGGSKLTGGAPAYMHQPHSMTDALPSAGSAAASPSSSASVVAASPMLSMCQPPQQQGPPASLGFHFGHHHYDPQQQSQQQLMLQQQFFPNQQIIHSQYSEVINGSTPMSAIAANTFPAPLEANIEQIASSILNDDFDDDSGYEEGNKAVKKSSLPKQSTAVMKAWLFQHIMHPYPSEEEKRELSRQTNLSLLQVNNWFINARRRILQPMKDDDSTSNKSKKAKTTSKVSSTDKPWPGHLQHYHSPQSFSHLEAGVDFGTASPASQQDFNRLNNRGASLTSD